MGLSDNDNTISFDSVISSNNLDKKSHNILRIDIEDTEWDIFQNINLDSITPYFAQMIFEFHNCNPRSEELSSKLLKVLEKILNFYTPIHTNFNNCRQAFYVPKTINYY